MSFTVIIPARYGSTRIPGKALLDIGGKPLIQHVHERAQESKAGRVIIATDDDRIQDAVRGFGGEVHMTSPLHRSGTERIAEVVASLDEPDDAMVVNLQGDEPQIPKDLLDQVAALLREPDCTAQVSSLCEPIGSGKELFDPNVVKVVLDDAGYALYFSRAPIPWHREAFSNASRQLPETPVYYRHIGIYAYQVGFLKQIPHLPIAELEQTESLEQLRLMFHGYRIRVAPAALPAGIGVDTPEDLKRVRALFAQSAVPSGERTSTPSR